MTHTTLHYTLLSYLHIRPIILRAFITSLSGTTSMSVEAFSILIVVCSIWAAFMKIQNVVFLSIMRQTIGPLLLTGIRSRV